jgi:hypothetical protein
MPERFGKNQKPLFVINGPVKAKVYRSNFKPFETLRFLDAKKLNKVRQQWLELGTIEAVGRSATLVGKIVKGELTNLRLQGCAGCRPKGKKRKRAIDKNLLMAIRDKLEGVRAGTIKLRQRLPSSRRLTQGKINIRIWPFPPIVIVITIDDGTFCITIFVGNGFCYLCTDGDVVASTCIPRH